MNHTIHHCHINVNICKPFFLCTHTNTTSIIPCHNNNNNSYYYYNNNNNNNNYHRQEAA